ncbi:DUF5305 family protein [Halorhabdus salina]|uniref:DUF5305 family protein n=1 Tax=Halorhabdus salina TaxID=2750670 RepID=UPI0015EEEE83|nr:DUF5305 family protein [Halorhabdus salina]
MLSVGGVIGLLFGRQSGLCSRQSTATGSCPAPTGGVPDEWITTGRVPGVNLAAETIDITVLEGLIDVAIDPNSRVIEDGRRNACFVLDDGRRYRSERPHNPAAVLPVVADV